MASRLERLEESLEKYYEKIEETKKKIEEEKAKILANKEKEEKKLQEMMERYKKLFGKLPGEDTDTTSDEVQY